MNLILKGCAQHPAIGSHLPTLFVNRPLTISKCENTLHTLLNVHQDSTLQPHAPPPRSRQYWCANHNMLCGHSTSRCRLGASRRAARGRSGIHRGRHRSQRQTPNQARAETIHDPLDEIPGEDDAILNPSTTDGKAQSFESYTLDTACFPTHATTVLPGRRNRKSVRYADGKSSAYSPQLPHFFHHARSLAIQAPARASCTQLYRKSSICAAICSKQRLPSPLHATLWRCATWQFQTAT